MWKIFYSNTTYTGLPELAPKLGVQAIIEYADVLDRASNDPDLPPKAERLKGERR
jgi:hypothetical protein